MKKDVINTKELEQQHLDSLDAYIDTLDLNRKEESLIPTLYKAQNLFGYLPQNLQWYIGQKLDLPSAHVNGVVSFYSFFSEKPLGKYTVSVCMGTACFVKGADKVLDRVLKKTGTEPNEMSDDGKFTVKDVRCIGACGLAPVVTVNDKVYGKIGAKAMEDIISNYQEEDND